MKIERERTSQSSFFPNPFLRMIEKGRERERERKRRRECSVAPDAVRRPFVKLDHKY